MCPHRSKLQSATCDVELTGDAGADWVHLFPPGRTTGRDGRVFDLVDPAAVILDFEARGVDLPVDYDHQLDDEKTRTGPIPAAGWIKALKVDDRGLWGRVQWTATAAELIGQKAYRYLSPTFLFYPATSEVVRLTGAGLVHKPNLPLKALAREEPPMNTEKGQPNMGQPIIARLAAALGLPAAAPEADIVAMVEQLVATVRRLSAKPDTATAAELVKVAAPDPTRYVPVEAVQDMLRSRNVERAEASEGRAQEKVRAALQGGHIIPAMRDWALALCRADEASFDSFLVKSGAPWSYLTRETHTGGTPPSAANGRADPAPGSLAAAVCAQLGLKPGAITD